MHSGSLRVAHVAALLLCAVLGGVTASRIAPSSQVGRRSAKLKPLAANDARAVKAHNIHDAAPKAAEASSKDSAKPSALVQAAGVASKAAAENQGTVTQLAARFSSFMQEHVNVPKAGGVPRYMVVMSIVTFLLVVFSLAFCLPSCCAGRSKNKYEDFKEMSGNRQQFIVDGQVIYEWDQGPSVTTIYIQVPKGLTKDDMEIKISRKRLKVGRKGKPPFMKEETYGDVNEEDSAWRLRSTGELQIYLSKAEQGEWPTVFLQCAGGMKTLTSLPRAGRETRTATMGSTMTLPATGSWGGQSPR